MELLDASVAVATTGGPSMEIETVTESGSVAAEAWKHFGPFENVSGTFRVEMTGTNDADLYVREGAQPTTSTYDARPYTGSSNESIAIEVAGSYYVSVRGYSAATFAITFTISGGTLKVAGSPELEHVFAIACSPETRPRASWPRRRSLRGPSFRGRSPNSSGPPPARRPGSRRRRW